MHNIKIIVAYDGTSFLGWQKTRTGPSIEECLQSAIEQILQHPITLQAASRTDQGVHANGQVVNFLTLKPIPNFNIFRTSLNALLPKSIVILKAEEMSLAFHPTLDSIGKEYRYFICYGPTQMPQYRHFSWHVHYLLQLNKIKEALPYFIGTHDFSAFCNFKKNAHYSSYIRQISKIEIIELEERRFYFQIIGNHFLYRMARNLVGTLIGIGRGQIDLSSIPHILESKKRAQAGMTAPAHGLFLHQVFYS